MEKVRSIGTRGSVDDLAVRSSVLHGAKCEVVDASERKSIKGVACFDIAGGGATLVAVVTC